MANIVGGPVASKGFDIGIRVVDKFNTHRNAIEKSKASKFKGDPVEYSETSVAEFKSAIKTAKKVLKAEKANVEADEQRGRWRYAVVPGTSAKREGSNSRVRAAIDKLDAWQTSHDRNVETRVRQEARDARDAAKEDRKTSKTAHRSSSVKSHRSDKDITHERKPPLRGRRHSFDDAARPDDKKMAKKSKKPLELPTETSAGFGGDGSRLNKDRRHDRNDLGDINKRNPNDIKAGKRDASLRKSSTKARSRSRDAHQQRRPATPLPEAPKTRGMAEIKPSDTPRINRVQNHQRVSKNKPRTIQEPDKHKHATEIKQNRDGQKISLAKLDPCYRRYR
ncbi:hypothetical protein F5Y19DRAFT_473707 [Xylariaceae sp. FL1651]|nr:hypothetical protein F5Y19DRAFT_473707 [Xylariaceae sp. FL1651]